MLIPKSLAENNTSGPLTVFGHGLFGSGSSYVRAPDLLQMSTVLSLSPRISRDGVPMEIKMP